VQRVGLLSICLTGTQPGNAERSYRILAKILCVKFNFFANPCWITSFNASTRLNPPFFNISAAVESAPCCFSGITGPFLFPHDSANQCQLHHLSNRLDVLVAPIRSLRSSVLQNVFFDLASTWFLLVNSSPFLARHIATCGSNGRRTLFRRMYSLDVILRESCILRCCSISMKTSSSSCLAFFLNKRLYFVRASL
jgi:hypothetical protein